MNKIKNVAIFCGSSRGRDSIYGDTAIELARYMVEHEMTMINGGGSIGIMGIMADEMIKMGGKCIGVIPLHLKELEVAHKSMNEMIVTHDMASRMKVIMGISDAYITLPGGFGTLDELFEVLTLSQLSVHSSPVGLLNINGFFNPIFDMFDLMTKEGFLGDYSRDILLVDEKIDRLFTKMKNYKKEGFSIQKIIDQKTEKV